MNNPPTGVGGITEIRRVWCRLSLNYPPTDVDGIPELREWDSRPTWLRFQNYAATRRRRAGAGSRKNPKPVLI